MHSSLQESEGGSDVANSSAFTINKAFTWISLIDRLAGGDITKHDSVRDINVNYAFYYLMYLKDSDRVEANKRAEREAKSKLKR